MSPWVLTRVVSEVKSMVHPLNILLVVSYNLGVEQAQTMLDVCSQLGLLVNMDKSELISFQDFKMFIGARFNLARGPVFLSEGSALKLAKLVRLFRTSKA